MSVKSHGLFSFHFIIMQWHIQSQKHALTFMFVALKVYKKKSSRDMNTFTTHHTVAVAGGLILRAHAEFPSRLLKLKESVIM